MPSRWNKRRSTLICCVVVCTCVVSFVSLNRGPARAEAYGDRTANAARVASTATPRAARTLPRFAEHYQRPESVPFPADNAFTPDRELLGRTLFFDPRLSVSGFISCATCHNPGFSWGDGMARAIGHGMKTLGRRTPTVLNTAFADLLFWDGRAESLEEQALGPIAAPGEMNMPIEQLISRLNSIQGYGPLFAKAYPGEPIAKETVAKAIATFERTVVSGVAPFDRYVAGETDAISPAARRGFELFNTKAHCATCHSGWNFTDGSFHDIGLPGDDKGRGAILTGVEAMQFAHKTPTLRNADQRAPFMHDGSEADLEQVVEFYNQGGRARRPSLSKEIFPLNLTTEEKADLVAFLKTLTSNDKPTEVPTLPR